MIVENSLKLKALLKGTDSHAVLHGNCLELLRDMPPNIVQTVITSPPYFGLRNYGTNPQIWGGKPDCDHKWVTTLPRRLRSEKDVKNPDTIQNANKGANCALPTTRACETCGAWEGELGLEPTPELFIEHLCEILDEVKRVLREDGTVWLNIADTYWAGKGQSGQQSADEQEARAKNGETLNRGHHNIAGKHATRPQDGRHPTIKPKDLCLVPQRLAIALQERGWYLRMEVIWSKKNCMPESMEDRCTRSHEQIWVLSKNRDYYYDKYGFTTPPKEEILQQILADAEFGANLRTVWIMNASGGYRDDEGQHHATFPPELPERCIKLGTSVKGACKDCGAPYERDVEKTYPLVTTEPPQTTLNLDTPEWYGSGGSSFQGHSGYVKADGTSMVPVVVTKGWSKSCKCETNEIRPCIVMDIFNGTGTTGLVAMQNGRAYIGLELLERFVRMTEKRFTGGMPLLEMMV
jgi:DNA modification methylase